MNKIIIFLLLAVSCKAGDLIIVSGGQGWIRTNQWLTLSIPYVSDIKKANERKSEYQKEKKK